MTEQGSNSGQPDGGAAGPRLVTVDAESAGRRVDNFLMGELKGLPRTRIYRIIRTGEVRVNKGRVKPAHRLEAGDVVRVPPVKDLPEQSGSGVSQARASWINDYVLYEDQWVLVLNKPTGLAVHGGSGISLGAIEVLRAARPELYFLELVHRLDRDTSGCLLFAKKRSSLRRLHEGFREGQIRKVYRALVCGIWDEGDREVSMPLVTEHRKNGERHVRPGSEGKEAVTRFFVEQQYVDFACMRIELLTGRTHQIRVHAAALGHPVAGDSRYGDLALGPLPLKRLFLHAAELGFAHPDSNEWVKFSAPMDDNLQTVLRVLNDS